MSIGSALGQAVAGAVSGSGSHVGSSGGSSTARRVPRGRSSGHRSSGGGGGSSSSHRSNGGGGGGNSGGGGGGGGGYVAPKPPAPPSLASYLGTDSGYQQAVAGGKRSLATFLSDLGRRRGEAGTQYKQTQASMESDRVQQLSDLRDEFASRGLIQSGLYGKEQGDFQKKFTDQSNALNQQQTSLLADLLSQEKNYRTENQNALDQAKQEALLRRAQKYNIT